MNAYGFSERRGAGLEPLWLRYGRCLALRNAAGLVLVCRAGEVWITQEDDPRDIELKAGASFTFDRTGLAVVTGCTEAALVELAERPPCSARVTQYELHRWARRSRAQAISASVGGLARLVESYARQVLNAFTRCARVARRSGAR